MQNGFTQAILELDSLYIVDILLKESTTNYRLSQIADKIGDILNTSEIQIMHCYREANHLANCLAKMAAKRQQVAFFYSNQQLPSEVEGPLMLDKEQMPNIRNKYDKANFFVS